MKRFIFVGLVISMLFSFTACKKDPKYFWEDIEKMLNADDCEKGVTDAKDYIKKYGDQWKEDAIAQIKAAKSKGESLSKKEIREICYPKSMEERLEHTKCIKTKSADSLCDDIDSLWHSVRDYKF